MTWFAMIHGPEVWLLIAQIAIGLAVFNAGLLAGMWLSTLFSANEDDDDDR